MKKITIIVLDRDEVLPRGSWEYWASDMIIKQTEVSDTYKVLKSKWDAPGGFIRRIVE